MNVTKSIEEDWSSEPKIRDACLNLWSELAARQVHLDHYTFGDLQSMSKENDPSLVSKALLYFSNPRLQVLKTCLMYEFRGLYLALPDEEVEHFSKGDVIVHPEFGEPIPESEIIICFTVGRGLHDRRSV